MCESFEVVSISCGILNSFVGFLFIDRHYWYICFVILFFHFVQRRAEHPLPRSLPESKLSDLAERTDYEAFYNDTFLKGIYRVRVPGTTGHHKVKMVRKITANVSVLPLLRVNKLATSFNYLSRFIVIKRVSVAREDSFYMILVFTRGLISRYFIVKREHEMSFLSHRF